MSRYCRMNVGRVLIVAALAGGTSAAASAQGPLADFYYQPELELSWASAHLTLEGGARLRIPFLPVVDGLNSPYGTANYARDVRVQAPLAFVPAAPEGIDVTGRAVLMPMDRPKGVEAAAGDLGLAARLHAMADLGAAAVVLFSFRQPHPFLLDEEGWLPSPSGLPVVTITREAARTVLASSTTRLDEVEMAWRQGSVPEPAEMISRLELQIHGRFERIETEHFVFRFQPGHFADNGEIAEVNEDAVAFLLDLFAGQVGAWTRTTVTYFPDFDSKVFFTHHWGSGLGADHGIFLVQNETETSRGLVVHEQAHILIGSNWGWSTSFLAEGVATYAESMATDPGDPCRQVWRFHEAGELFSLGEMLGFQVGAHSGTSVAYPAGGCFIRFLVDAHSLETMRQVYELEARSPEEKARASTWRLVFDTDLAGMEREWLDWLRAVAR